MVSYLDSISRNATTRTRDQMDKGTPRVFLLIAFSFFKKDYFREKKEFGIFLLFRWFFLTTQDIFCP